MRTNTFEHLDGKGLKIGIVASRFNGEMMEGLLQGCLAALIETGVAQEDVTTIRVPGSFETPHGVWMLLQRGGFDAIIAMGIIIKGETRHDELIADAVARAIMRFNTKQEVPVLFGIVTAETIEQARVRSGEGEDNRGRDAALAAVEMALLRRSFT
ncbi:MAG: 6,7-dimethyl-8-ribityllumazine synthase [bacterium]|nr:6,7-dimethyl-8-ribityllumazine synthase [bacterium]